MYPMNSLTTQPSLNRISHPSTLPSTNNPELTSLHNTYKQQLSKQSKLVEEPTDKVIIDEQPTEDIPISDEGHVLDSEDTDNAYMPKIPDTTTWLRSIPVGILDLMGQNKYKNETKGLKLNLQAGGEYEDKDEDIRRSPYNDKDTEDIRRYS
ncbi:hypothetical protein Tco_0481252 [Tanacetum coccineum]